MVFEQPPPMPVRAFLAATVRETGLYDQRGEADEIPVGRVEFFDVTGDARIMDFTPELAMDLLRQLAAFVAQVGCQPRP